MEKKEEKTISGSQQATSANGMSLAMKEKGDVTYNVAGNDVHLNCNIVRNYLTKGSGRVSDADIVQFISVCKFNQLNPFLNEAFLVKYGESPAQMVVSKEALMKRAEACDGYQGFEAGVIVQHGDAITDITGSFIAPGDTLVGGWAIVHRSDRQYPFVSRVNFSEYSTGRSLWSGKPSTMIRKVAIVQAMREAFPAQLGAMYTQEETNVVVDTDAVDVTEKVKGDIADNANKVELTIDDTGGPNPDKSAAQPKDTEAQVPDETEHSKSARIPGF